MLLDYLNDVDDGVRLLCAGSQWKEAMRVCYKHGRDDLVGTVVVPMAAEKGEALLEEARELPDKVRREEREGWRRSW